MNDLLPTPSAGLVVAGLAKSYGGVPVFRDLSFMLKQGETLALLGRSGGGKTTLLKCIAGLLAPDAGAIRLAGRDLGALPPEKRGAVYLYQEPLLLPHLDIYENLALGLRLRHEPGPAIRSRLEGLVAALGLGDHLRKYPAQISGGQRQRVAFGRALAIEPAVLLLDEPLGSLDPETRADMQVLFRRVAHEAAVTTVFVTHDTKEALVVGDRFGLLHAGILQLYADRAAFAADPASGVDEERRFWRTLGDDLPRPVAAGHPS